MEAMQQQRSCRRRGIPLFSVLSLLLFALLRLCALPHIQASPLKPFPFIVLHGIGDQCKNEGIMKFTEVLSEMSGAEGHCVSVGNGWRDSYFTHLEKQAAIICQKVREKPELQDGYNIVGLSQGSMIARAVIEWCPGGPPVYNFVSLGGPHAGIAAVPLCVVMSLCRLINAVIGRFVYTQIVQNHLAPSGYIKIPTELSRYYKGTSFLPRLNNEIAMSRNEIYKKRLSSLNHLTLIMFTEDVILTPPQTAWFGYYANNDFGGEILPANETDLYKEDWIGLQTLDKAGKLSFVAFPGNHLSISETEMEDHIVPFLVAPSESSRVTWMDSFHSNAQMDF
ncbi:unnamed protein product [Sphagnum troendelagicum]|uniref:Palmitoyl-protein thioesterase 1 n=1 Tax=Sphagnum troendelagicum TaxID=128251 RepID=A0ABP0TTM6_9BRYO